MTGIGALLIGAFVGAYVSNPTVRAQVDTAARKAIGAGIDFMNAAPLASEENGEDDE